MFQECLNCLQAFIFKSELQSYDVSLSPKILKAGNIIYKNRKVRADTMV